MYILTITYRDGKKDIFSYPDRLTAQKRAMFWIMLDSPYIFSVKLDTDNDGE